MEIVLNTKIFTEEQKVGLKPQIKQLVTDLSRDLDISSLQQFIVPDNFTEEVISFQEKYNKEEKGHTKNGNEEAMAKVMYYRDKEEYCQVIFFHEALLAPLVSHDERLAKQSVFYILHELGHVHDEAQKRQIYSEELREGVGRHILDFTLTRHSDIVWSEYFANRTASTQITSELFLEQFDHTFILIDRVKNECDTYIKEYRKHGNINLLKVQIEESTNLLFYFTALIIGSIHYYREVLGEEDVKKIEGLIDEKVQQTYYGESWSLIEKALGILYSKYPKWNDIYELDELNQAIHKCWNSLGIFLERNGDENLMYINVP
ncbi:MULTISPECIES: hypothetical protein [Bacillus cereus group]|uniref:Uncharacterized protein n=1 Tax=Bacillus cereus VD118 TaxID=1053231 RepID=R8QBF8_BACCE|nr:MULTISPECIES: hypothetical protein [Bacillus cereus group]EOP67743.1 hypothetical protein IIQ_05281 [Bacillus cereus VD118]MBJ8095973.1 hypothetical protein [Bacillus cereus]MCQ6360244.1 hypothetical protein [Bacillus cereus]CAH2464307.1 hypothetical protein ACOSJ1_EBGNOMHC_04841 [Bacillus mycoides KBAB4]